MLPLTLFGGSNLTCVECNLSYLRWMWDDVSLSRKILKATLKPIETPNIPGRCYFAPSNSLTHLTHQLQLDSSNDKLCEGMMWHSLQLWLEVLAISFLAIPLSHEFPFPLKDLQVPLSHNSILGPPRMVEFCAHGNQQKSFPFANSFFRIPTTGPPKRSDHKAMISIEVYLIYGFVWK